MLIGRIRFIPAPLSSLITSLWLLIEVINFIRSACCRVIVLLKGGVAGVAQFDSIHGQQLRNKRLPAPPLSNNPHDYCVAADDNSSAFLSGVCRGAMLPVTGNPRVNLQKFPLRVCVWGGQPKTRNGNFTWRAR